MVRQDLRKVRDLVRRRRRRRRKKRHAVDVVHNLPGRTTGISSHGRKALDGPTQTQDGDNGELHNGVVGRYYENGMRGDQGSFRRHPNTNS